jgi:hypothetical protein
VGQEHLATVRAGFEPGFSTGLEPFQAVLERLKPVREATLKRAGSKKNGLFDRPAQAGGNEEPAEAGLTKTSRNFYKALQ